MLGVVVVTVVQAAHGPECDIATEVPLLECRSGAFPSSPEQEYN